MIKNILVKSGGASRAGRESGHVTCDHGRTASFACSTSSPVRLSRPAMSDRIHGLQRRVTRRRHSEVPCESTLTPAAAARAGKSVVTTPLGRISASRPLM